MGGSFDRLKSRLLVRSGAAAVGAMARGSRAIGHGQSFVRGLLDEALTDEEKTRFTLLVYDGSPHYRGDDLYAWEAPWFDAHLPDPPGRVLLGACGAGREILALQGRGHDVTAFEPAPGLAALARERSTSEVVECTYEELADAVLDEVDNAASELARGTWDAVLLGWGSFGHVLDRSERGRCLEALDRLCPRGPLLGSYPPVQRRSTEGRAGRVGRKLGKLLASATGAEAAHENTALLPWAGYLAAIEREELEAHGRQLNRGLDLVDGHRDYPHFVLTPSALSA